jgi:glycosyltransferase involved in cell wall biosynthesis
MGAAAFSLSMGGRLSNGAMDQKPLPLEPGSTSSRLPHCSVVVATRNRSSNLRRLLEGLVQQAGAPAFEVVVADNGSLDDTSAVIDSFRSELTLHSVRVLEPGKGRALNAALALAQGEIIVFTDDDVMPAPDWLNRLYASALANPDKNIFGGKIRVDEAPVPNWIRKSFNLMGLLTARHDKGERDTIYPSGEYPLGPNMAIRQEILNATARPYPEDMGPGTGQPVGDEVFFFMQFSPPEATDRLYIAGAVVTHEVEEENIKFPSALRRAWLAGRSRAWENMPSDNSLTRIASAKQTILRRLQTCRSLRELACLSARYMGYRWGVRERRVQGVQ